EAIRRPMPHRRPVLHDRPLAVPSLDEPARPHLDHGLADRAARDAVTLHQLRLTRHHVAGLEHPGPDLPHDLIGDLHVPRPRPAPLYRSSHSRSPPPMLLYMSQSQEATPTPLHSVSVAGVVVREDGRLL